MQGGTGDTCFQGAESCSRRIHTRTLNKHKGASNLVPSLPGPRTLRSTPNPALPLLSLDPQARQNQAISPHSQGCGCLGPGGPTSPTCPCLGGEGDSGALEISGVGKSSRGRHGEKDVCWAGQEGQVARAPAEQEGNAPGHVSWGAGCVRSQPWDLYLLLMHGT